MAYDPLDVDKDLFPFHPCDTPRGNLWYDSEALTFAQKQQLNDLKIATIKENNRYLAKHPEVRALILLLLKSYFRDKPRCGIARYAGNFFSRPKTVIEHEVRKYLRQRGEPRKKEGDSAVIKQASKSIKGSLTDIFLNDFDMASNQSDINYVPDLWDWWTEQKGETTEEEVPRRVESKEDKSDTISVFLFLQSDSDTISGHTKDDVKEADDVTEDVTYGHTKDDVKEADEVTEDITYEEKDAKSVKIGGVEEYIVEIKHDDEKDEYKKYEDDRKYEKEKEEKEKEEKEKEEKEKEEKEEAEWKRKRRLSIMSDPREEYSEEESVIDDQEEIL